MTKLPVGILGGTFDPPHLGHLQLAKYAIDERGLKRLVIVPSFLPPHKKGRRITPFEHRVAMVRHACAEWKNLQPVSVSRIEENLPSPSFLVDTLEAIVLEEGNRAELYFLLGSDSFRDLPNWKQYKDILRMVHLVVVPRAEVKGPDASENLLGELGYVKSGHGWESKVFPKRIFQLQQLPARISSTEIRKMIRADNLEDAAKHLPRSVQQYILEKKLYRNGV